MKTFERICLEDYEKSDSEGNIFKIKRGDICLTSIEKDNMVTVFKNFWVKVPISLFAGEKQFTG